MIAARKRMSCVIVIQFENIGTSKYQMIQGKY